MKAAVSQLSLNIKQLDLGPSTKTRMPNPENDTYLLNYWHTCAKKGYERLYVLYFLDTKTRFVNGLYISLQYLLKPCISVNID